MTKTAWIIKLRWDEYPDSSLKGLFDFLLARTPISLYPKIEGEVWGKRWPRSNFSKMVTFYERHGAVDVKGIQFLYQSRPCHFYVFAGMREDRKYLVAHLKGDYWSSVDIHAELRVFVSCFRLHYGQMAQSPEDYRGVVGDEHINYKDVTKRRKDALMMYRYFEARKRWFINQNIDTSTTEHLNQMAFVYRFNLLSDVHLQSVIPKLNCKLDDWILSDTQHGTLERVTDYNAIWHVNNEQQKRVINALWHTGLFPIDEYFEILGWSDDLSIPVLRAHRSVRPLLIGSDKDTLYVD